MDLADVNRELVNELDLRLPDERLRARGLSRLAELLATTRLVRVDAALAGELHAAGVPTYEVGYHRGSDGLLFAEESRAGRQERAAGLALGSSDARPKIRRRRVVCEADVEGDLDDA